MYKIHIEILILTCYCVSVYSEIFCGRDGDKLICSPDEDFNTLQSGLVSDDDSIESISLLGCRVTSIEYLAFQNLQNLKNLDLSINVLTNVEFGIFDNLNNLQLLNLSMNLLSDLPIGIFDHLVGLQVLDLSHNQIMKLTPEVFDHTQILNWLSISNNQMSQLTLNLFEKMPALSYLDLSFNPIEELPNRIFYPCQHLKVLNLGSTHLFTLPADIFNENSEIVKLFLFNNGFNHIPDGYFYNLQNLKLLDISNNKLGVLKPEVFGSLYKMNYLNISGNELTDITPIVNLPEIMEIDASRNQLQSLPVFNSTTIRQLDISGNFFTHFGTNLGMHLPKRLNILKLHKNPWQCACLNQLLGVLQRRKIVYKDNVYFNGKKPVCVFMSNKAARCFRDSSHNEYFFNTYFNALNKYKT